MKHKKVKIDLYALKIDFSGKWNKKRKKNVNKKTKICL